MAYSAITTKADGDILSAAHLNTLSANQEYLYGLARQTNTPFTSYRESTDDLDNTDQLWSIRHRLQYLHYSLSLQDASNTVHQRIFYNGTKIVEQSGAHAGITGFYDLSAWDTFPNDLGAWVTATGYDDDEGEDGDVVDHGGEHYKCIASHTSGASTEPGVGASWATVWVLLTPPTVGAMYDVWASIGKSVPAECTIDYLLESDATSI